MADSEIEEIQEQSRRVWPLSPESGYAFASSERQRGNSSDGEELSLFPVRHFQLDKPDTSPQLDHYETRQWRADQERPASAQKSDVGQRILGLPARRVALREAQMPQNPQASLGFEDSQSRNLFSTFIPRAAIAAMDRQPAPGSTVGQPTAPAPLNRDHWFPGLNQGRPHSLQPRVLTGQTSANQQPLGSQRPAVKSTLPDQADDAIRLGHIRTGAGPVESNPLAWNAFMQGLDNQKVGGFTVAELANVLTNESRDLSFIGPTVSLFDNDLDQAKYVQAHAIINNALRKVPNKMANRTVTRAAAASRGHDRDVAIMRQAYFDRMTRGVDPAQGRTYFGNSADLILKSSPIGNSRHTVFARFGPFVLGSQKPQYIYIYNNPIEKKTMKKGKH